MDSPALWDRFQKHLCSVPSLDLTLDVSRMNFADDYFAAMAPRIDADYREMAELEKGAIANADEKRMVGHYWLRNPQLAPSPQITDLGRKRPSAKAKPPTRSPIIAALLE